MSLKSKPVKIPENCKLKILTNGYVYYFTKSVWNAEKKRPDDDRICIGKLDETKTKLIPNKNYAKVFNIQVLEEPGEISTELSAGQYIAIKRAADFFGAFEALKKNFPKSYEKIFALVLFMIDNSSNASQQYEKWGFRNYSGLDINLSSQRISEIYSSIDEDSIHDFFKDYVKNYKKTNLIKKRLSLAFDSTNCNTNSDSLDLAEFGHAKDDKNLKIINSAYLVDQLTGIPICYENFYGSLLDKIETEYSINKFREIGFDKILLVMDRGYFSVKNKELLSNEKYIFLMPETHGATNYIIDAYGKGIKDVSKYYISEEKVYGTRIYFSNDELEDYKDFKNERIFLFYDSKRAEEERTAILENANKMKEYVINNYKKYSNDLKEKYKNYLLISKDIKSEKGSLYVSINHQLIQKRIDRAGFFVAITNDSLTPLQTLTTIRKRDCVEKVFKRMKDGLGLNTPLVHNNATYNGKMFVVFLALNLIETFRWFEKSYFEKNSSSTTFTVLGELSKIIFTFKEETITQKYALTAKQKNIFTNLALPLNNITNLLAKD